jgi:phage-related minor tail protein
MAANNIKGITIEIGGDTSPLQKALEGVNKTSRDLQSELKEVDRLLKLDPNNTDLLNQKQKLLAESVTNTSTKLETLREAEKQVQQQFTQGKISEEQYRALQREVIKTEQSLEKLEGEAIKANAVLSKDDAVNNLKSMGKAAVVAGAAIGAALVGAGVAAMNSSDKLQRLSDVTGISAERLQELQYAGNNLGVELETITGAQAKLTKSMAGATDETKGTGLAFATLGVEVRDKVTGELRSAQDVMNEAFTALNGIGNETERDALAMSIFGKSAMELNPLIKAGGDELNKLSEEARNNGSVMSNEAVAAYDSLGDTIDNFKNGVLGGIGEKLAGLLPTIQGIIDKMLELPQWVQENSTFLTILGVVIATVTALVIAFNIQQALLASGLTLWGAIASVGTTITTALGTAFTFLTGPIGLVILAIGALIAIFVLLWNNCEGFRNFFINMWESIKQATSAVLEGYIIPFIRDQLVPMFQKAFQTIGDVVKGAFNVMQWAWDNILKPLFEDIILPFIQNVVLPTWNVIFSGIGGAVSSAFGIIEDLWNNSLKPIFNGILDFISGVFTGNWQKAFQGLSDIFSGVFNGLIAIAKAPINTIIGMLNGFIRGINKIQIPDWVPGVGGRGISIPTIPMLAKGTDFFQGGMAIVGEAGPELVQLPRGSSVIPNNRLQTVGGGTANIVIELDGRTIAKAIGQPLVEQIRVRTGLKL